VKTDGRRISKHHRKLKTLALGRGWWVPSGLNKKWELNKEWEQYYERKLSENHPPVSRYDKCLIAEARSRGIKTPLASALNGEWRLHLKVEIAENAILERQSKRESGRPLGAWNKIQASPKDPTVVVRRLRRQSKAKTRNKK
jgi:hypothetical protein